MAEVVYSNDLSNVSDRVVQSDGHKFIYAGQIDQDSNASGHGSLYYDFNPNNPADQKGLSDQNQLMDDAADQIGPKEKILYYGGNFCNGLPETSWGVLYNTNKKVMYIGSIAKGRREGNGVSFGEDGLIHQKGVFVKNKLHGESCQRFYPDGVLQYSGSFESDKIQGFCTEFYQNASKKSQGVYKNGLFEGKNIVVYHENGKIQYKGCMKDGLKHGEGELFWPNGILRYKGLFLND
jgi:antitoxin component YwqK of YwqJK toxin-antitoxin module